MQFCLHLRTGDHIGGRVVFILFITKEQLLSTLVPNVLRPGQTLATFQRNILQYCCMMLRHVLNGLAKRTQHIAIGWPNVRNMLCPTMLQDVASVGQAFTQPAFFSVVLFSQRALNRALYQSKGTSNIFNCKFNSLHL